MQFIKLNKERVTTHTTERICGIHLVLLRHHKPPRRDSNPWSFFIQFCGMEETRTPQGEGVTDPASVLSHPKIQIENFQQYQRDSNPHTFTCFYRDRVVAFHSLWYYLQSWRDSNPRLSPWQGDTLTNWATRLFYFNQFLIVLSLCGNWWSRTTRVVKQQIYSLSRYPYGINSHFKNCGTDGARTQILLINSQTLYTFQPPFHL